MFALIGGQKIKALGMRVLLRLFLLKERKISICNHPLPLMNFTCPLSILSILLFVTHLSSPSLLRGLAFRWIAFFFFIALPSGHPVGAEKFSSFDCNPLLPPALPLILRFSGIKHPRKKQHRNDTIVLGSVFYLPPSRLSLLKKEGK